MRGNRLPLLIVALAVLLAATAAHADQITRVGIIDIEKIYSIYFRESKAVKDLQERQAALVRDLKRIDEEIADMESRKLEADGRGDMTESLRLDQEIFRRRQYREDYKRVKSQQIRKSSESLYQSDEFLDELSDAIQFVAESEGFSMILNNSSQFRQSFLYYTKEIDITERVIQELMTRAGRR